MFSQMLKVLRRMKEKENHSARIRRWTRNERGRKRKNRRTGQIREDGEVIEWRRRHGEEEEVVNKSDSESD
jgi:hypothetical protein